MTNNPNALNPLFTDRDTTNGTGVSSQAARMGLGNLHQSVGVTLGFASGVFPGRSTGTTIQDMRVVATSPTPDMNAFIQTGGHSVNRTGRGPYLDYLQGGLAVAFSASNSSNNRKDYVVARVRDPGYDGTVLQTLQFLVLQGVPASTPAEPTGSVTDGDVVLACVTVRAGTTQILDSDIEDRRQFNVARGGIYPKNAYDDRPGSFPGQLRYNIASLTFEGWTGTAWVPVASMTQWGTFTPKMMTQGANNGGPQAQVNLGSGGLMRSDAWWSLLGKRLEFSYHFQFGVTGIYCPPGDVFVPLPTHVNNKSFQNVPHTQWCHAHLYINQPQLVADFIGSGLLLDNRYDIIPFFPIHGNSTLTKPYRIALTNGAAGTSIPLVPSGFAQGGELHLNGSVETVVPT